MLEIASGEDDFEVVADGEIAGEAVVLLGGGTHVHGDDSVAQEGDGGRGADGDGLEFLVVGSGLVGLQGLDSDGDVLVREGGQNDIVLAAGSAGGDGLTVVVGNVEVDAIVGNGSGHRYFGAGAIEGSTAIAIQGLVRNGDLDADDVVGSIGGVGPLDFQQGAEVVEKQLVGVVGDNGSGRQFDVLDAVGIALIFLPTRQVHKLVGSAGKASGSRGQGGRVGCIVGAIEVDGDFVVWVIVILHNVESSSIDVDLLAVGEENGVAITVDKEFAVSGSRLELDTEGDGLSVFLATNKHHGAYGCNAQKDE